MTTPLESRLDEGSLGAGAGGGGRGGGVGRHSLLTTAGGETLKACKDRLIATRNCCKLEAS